MSALDASQVDKLEEIDRRRHRRVKVNLLGRCMFADRREFPCQIPSISPGGADVISPVKGEVDDPIIAYIDHIGRIEGKITRHIEAGFAMAIKASSRKRDKLADTLTWLANRHILNLPEDRRYARRLPKKSEATLILDDGTSHGCRVIDMSLSGAGIYTKMRPPLGSRVNLGKLGARVVRHFEDGVAIEFMRIMSDAAIEKTIQKEFF